MNIHITNPGLHGKEEYLKNWIQWIALFLLFLASGLLVFVVFSHYSPFYEGKQDLFGRIVVGGVFLSLTLIARSSDRYEKYWLIPFAYLTGLTAISVDSYLSLSKRILPALDIIPDSPMGLAVEKLESSLLGIVVVLILNRLVNQDHDSLYIRRGNLRLGLSVGLVAVILMFAALIPVTETFFMGKNLTWSRILTWLPWILIFVVANASNEELIFRGLFIGKIEPFLGKWAANLVTTIPFVLVHSYARYAARQDIFLMLQVLPLSIAWCWLMQKTNSIWGSILFHAAMDIPVIVGIFSNF